MVAEAPNPPRCYPLSISNKNMDSSKPSTAPVPRDSSFDSPEAEHFQVHTPPHPGAHPYKPTTTRRRPSSVPPKTKGNVQWQNINPFAHKRLNVPGPALVMPNTPKFARRDVPHHASAAADDVDQRIGNVEVSNREMQTALRDMHSIVLDMSKYLNDVVPRAFFDTDDHIERINQKIDGMSIIKDRLDWQDKHLKDMRETIDLAVDTFGFPQCLGHIEGLDKRVGIVEFDTKETVVRADRALKELEGGLKRCVDLEGEIKSNLENT